MGTNEFKLLQFQEERLIGSALALPALDRCIKETIDYTRQRTIFGQPVLNNQSVHFKLAELQTEIEALRCMVQKATGIMLFCLNTWIGGFQLVVHSDFFWVVHRTFNVFGNKLKMTVHDLKFIEDSVRTI